MIDRTKISQAGALRLLAALAVALLWLQACGPAVLAAPQRPPRSAESAQPSRPAATPTPACFNRMAGTCGREWTDHGWDRRELVPTPTNRRR